MIKAVKKIVLSLVSVLGISSLIWTVFLLHPNLSYANKTQFDNITIYHNQELEEGTEGIVKNAMKIIRRSDIYDENLKIQLCLNDDKIYPNLYPFAGGTAYAFWNKAVMYASKPSFKHNAAEFKWEINNYELRKYNLTTLLAHEFMHTVQHHFNSRYYNTSTLGSLNWKLEGHAEYIAREFKNDGLLKSKIALFLSEENKDHVGVPVFNLEDGTIQNLSYFKYSLVTQYLMEIKEMNFDQICELTLSFDQLYSEMIEWSEGETIDDRG